MIINQDIMRRDTVQLLKDIETQIEEVKKTAQKLGIPSEKMRDIHGNWAMSPLLLAKAQAYFTLAQLQIKES